MPDYAVKKESFEPDLVQRLGRLDLIARVIAEGAGQGVHASRRRGFSTEFSDFKPYVPGDDLRFLDWRVFARTDRLFVKRFEAETNLELTLVLDATRSMAWRWQDGLSKLEYAVNFLAALACIHIGQRDQVGLLVHDANDLHHLPPRARNSQLEEIFGILAGVNPGSASTFPLLVEHMAQWRRHRGRILICSDLEEAEDEIHAALQDLGGRDDEVILFHVLDEAEIELPFSDATHLQDSETGDIISVNITALRQRHAETVANFRDTWRETCTNLGIGYIPIHTAMDYLDVVQALVDYLQR